LVCVLSSLFYPIIFNFLILRNLADTQDRGALDAVDFAIGMYFIQGVVTKKITFVPTTLPPGLYQQAGGSTNAGSVRPHMTGGSGSFSPVGSFFPPQHTVQMLQPEYTGSLTAPSLPARPNALPESNGHVAEWDVTTAEKAACDLHFNTLDTQRKGFIEGEIAVPFMLKSQLPGEILAQVWYAELFEFASMLTFTLFLQGILPILTMMVV